MITNHSALNRCPLTICSWGSVILSSLSFPRFMLAIVSKALIVPLGKNPHK